MKAPTDQCADSIYDHWSMLQEFAHAPRIPSPPQDQAKEIDYVEPAQEADRFNRSAVTVP